ncbi:hypothetical protein [Phreatobacter sp.]|uniref:hypothetical protein n=1 Tax=Phreatobacter sp. TaxID=1966341 RepID=UPI003F6F4582
MPYLLYIVGIFSVLAGIAFMMVARGGIHEATAAILWCGGFGIIGIAAILTELRKK